MQLFFDGNTGHLIVRMPQEFDHYMAQNMREAVDEALADERIMGIRFDFADTTFMDSSAIGFIMGRYEKISAFGGDVLICNIHPRMRMMLCMSGLQKYVTFEEECNE